MKVIGSFFVLALFSIAALAQQEGKIVASIASSGSVKNAPFSAEAVSESVQTLFDGNRIVHNSTSKLYRNGEGRVRREMDKGSGTAFGSFYNFEPGITIMDPLGSKMLLDSKLKIATEMSQLSLGELKIVGASSLTDEQKQQIDKLKTELKITEGQPLSVEQKKTLEKLHAELRVMTPTAVIPGSPVTGVMTTVGPTPFAYGFGSGDTKYDTKTEELGTRDFDGVSAEGTRRVTTIPAGAIGNDRPIETVYERWYSKELQMVVMSKHSDPRFGDQTYKLTNIVRAEPDPSLFTLPSGYKVVSDNGGGTANSYYYRVSTPTPAAAGQTPSPAKAKP